MKKIICGVIAALVLFGSGFAEATHYYGGQYSSAYPSVQQLEAGLNLYPGAMLPKEIEANGFVYTAWYLSARPVGGGRYAVMVQLRR